uniref:Transcription factor Adf-1-like n=1 Tax=Phallusia mammillata TaxID=59560 RepID=A0A6F9DRI4_9ASCI|nr:transcription factor Adf-1-like [Phallusia mammillata]
MDFNDILIQMVQDSPCIYNTHISHYKDQNQREKAWKKIAEHTGQKVETCMKRWKSLRDRFAKEKRRIENAEKNGAAVADLRVWEHYEALKFLQAHLRHKVTVGTFLPTSKRISDSMQDESVSEYAEVISLELVDKEPAPATSLSPTMQSTSRQGKKRKCFDQMDIEEEIYDMVRKNAKRILEMKMTLTKEQQNDEFTNFGNFVASSLRKLPEAKAYQSFTFIAEHLQSQRASLD